MGNDKPASAPPADAIREGDIFRFSYSDESRAKKFEPYHCFDGQLLAVKEGDGIVLLDTYWLYQFQPSGDGRRFTEATAKEQGALTFVCNLAEVDKVHSESETQYFDAADVFDLSSQHRCYPYFAVRKGAERSKEKMLSVLQEKMHKERSAIDSAAYNIQHLSRQMLLVEQDRLEEVYL